MLNIFTPKPAAVPTLAEMAQAARRGSPEGNGCPQCGCKDYRQRNGVRRCRHCGRIVEGR